jgi:PAS domain S-box-containing protein
MRGVWVPGVSALLQVAAAYLAFRLIGLTGRKRAWIIIAVAFLATAGYDLISLPAYLLGNPGRPVSWYHDLVVLLSSVLLLVGMVFIGRLFRDARASAEASLRSVEEVAAGERRYRLLLERIPEAFMVLVDGRLVFANPGLARIFGLQVGEALGRPLSDFVPEDGEAAGAGPLGDGARPSLAAARREVEVVDADGRTRWLEISVQKGEWEGRPAEIGLIQDIGERRRARDAVRREENLFARGPVVLLRWEPAPSRAVSYVSANVAHWGFDPRELLAGRQSFYDFVHPEDRERVHAEASSYLSQKVPSWEQEYRLACPDGQVRWVYDVTVVYRDAAGALTHYDGYLLDISERKRLEEQLRLAQKIEALGQLAGGIAHDFNNLLTAILGSCELIERHQGQEWSGAEELATIHRTASRAAALTRGLLAFARRQVLEPVDLDVNELIRGELPMLRRLVPENLTIDHIPGHKLGTVSADPGQLQQVIANLCVNARDAMPSGGRITLETENVVVNGAYVASHPWAREGRYVMLSVSDSGLGMSEKTMSHIFEPFFSTKGPGHGSGLGLATVYGIVKQHDGMVHAYSEHGKGSTFKVYLPQVERRASEVGNKIEGPVRGGDETILVVEDEEEVRGVLVGVLTSLGYRVLEAADGLEGLEMMAQEGNQVDLIITDIVMPRMGGKELQEAVLRVAPETLFLFSSGYSENVVHDGFIKKQGVSFIAKPYGIDTLAHTVRQVLDSKANRR